jgi:hypothetical protein
MEEEESSNNAPPGFEPGTPLLEDNEGCNLIDRSSGIEIYLRSKIYTANELLNQALEARSFILDSKKQNGNQQPDYTK